MELAVAGSFLLKPRLQYSRSTDAGAQEERFGRVCDIGDIGRRALWISRAPGGMNVCMSEYDREVRPWRARACFTQPHRPIAHLTRLASACRLLLLLQEVAGWFTATSEGVSKVLEVLKGRMTNDDGFDILVSTSLPRVLLLWQP